MSTPATAVAVAVTGHPVRVLIIDGHRSRSEQLRRALQDEGWEVCATADGSAAIPTARAFKPDLAVLDMDLPGADSLEVLRQLRARTDRVPVLFLSPGGDAARGIAGLTAGGDDCVSEPCTTAEVSARLHALLRDPPDGAAHEHPTLTVGDLTLDEESHIAHRGNDDIRLTATEFELLRLLMRNHRRVLSKAQILDRVWNYNFGGQANIVELYISYLRKKIDAGRAPMIHTMRGFGYVLKAAG